MISITRRTWLLRHATGHDIPTHTLSAVHFGDDVVWATDGRILVVSPRGPEEPRNISLILAEQPPRRQRRSRTIRGRRAGRFYIDPQTDERVAEVVEYPRVPPLRGFPTTPPRPVAAFSCDAAELVQLGQALGPGRVTISFDPTDPRKVLVEGDYPGKAGLLAGTAARPLGQAAPSEDGQEQSGPASA